MALALLAVEELLPMTAVPPDVSASTAVPFVLTACTPTPLYAVALTAKKSLLSRLPGPLASMLVPSGLLQTADTAKL
jgi:hypothetical protein